MAAHTRRDALLRRQHLLTLPLAALLLGCGDLPLAGGDGALARAPADLKIELERTLLAVGDTAALRFRVLDRSGLAIEHLVPWATPAWSASDTLLTCIRANAIESWSALLSDIRMLRVAEGSSRYYHGIVPFEGGNILGIAYLGFPVGLSYDALPPPNPARTWRIWCCMT